jgi:threonine/homoserine/homoserine lactone efflux protein
VLGLDVIAFGIAIGLAGAIPLGPVNLIVIRNALKRGLKGGLWAGLGAVAGDGLFAAIAAFGARSIEAFIMGHAFFLQLIGGTVLAVIGVTTARSRVDSHALEGDDAAISGATAGAKFASTLALTLANPAALAFVLGAYGAMGAALQLGSAPYRAALSVAGVMTGSLLWWAALSALVAGLRGRLTVAMLDRVNRWSGIALAAFGFAIVMHALGI